MEYRWQIVIGRNLDDQTSIDVVCTEEEMKRFCAAMLRAKTRPVFCVASRSGHPDIVLSDCM